MKRSISQLSYRIFKRFVLHPLYFLVRRSVLLSLMLIVGIPFIYHGAQNAWIRTENRVEDWIPSSFDETKLLMRFIGIFGADEILMVSWDGCTLDSPQLEYFRERLLAPTPCNGKEVVFFRKVLTGKNIYDTLREEPLSLSHQKAIDRMAGWLISPDGKTTCLIALISQDGLRYRKEAVAHVWDVAAHLEGVDLANVHVAGSTNDSVAVDNASRENLVELNLMSYAVCIVISFLCLTNIQATLLVFAMAVFNQHLCLAIIYYTGTPFDSILMLAVNLTFVLSISVGMYVVAYYRAAIAVLPPSLAVNRTIRDALLPTFGATSTTVLGLLSFLNSNMIPVRKFGMFSAASIAAAAVLTVVFVAGHYYLFPSRAWRKKDRSAKSGEIRDPWTAILLCRFVSPFVYRFHRIIVIVSVVLLFAGIAGTTQIQTFIGIRAMLPATSKPVRDYEWIEERIGPLIPVELVLVVREGDDASMYEQYRTVVELESRLSDELPDCVVIGPSNFLPPLPRVNAGARSIAANTIYRKQLFSNRTDFQESGYFRELDGNRYWRITVRDYAMRSEDHGPFLDKVQSVSDAFLQSKDGFAPGELIDHFVCGGVPLVYRAQKQLLADLQRSFLSAFLMILFILACIFRSLIRGIVVVFPNILPCLLIFGLLGWMGVKIELGTMLTGSAALGIAVDGAIHFITWYRFGIRDGNSRIEAINFAYRRCGTAMVQTTLVCACGLLVYSFSDFTPTVYFSFFMFFLLAAACLADLVLLPALMLGSAGSYFETKFFLGMPKPSSKPKECDRQKTILVDESR